MNTLEFIDRVRRRLGNPFPQAPSSRLILDRGMSFYRTACMQANNTANSWVSDEFTLTTTDKERRYELTSLAPRFSKALLVSTVPSLVEGTNEPELPLDFTQLEQIPRDWPYLQESGEYEFWSGYVTQKARIVAFYRTISDNNAGFRSFMEIRPTPDVDEQYRVLYQVGDWQSLLTAARLETFKFPFPEFDFYFVALTAQSLLPSARWYADEDKNLERRKQEAASIAGEIMYSQSAFDGFIASLSHPDIVWGESYADYCGF